MPVLSVRVFPESSRTGPQPGKVFIGISLKAGMLPREDMLQQVFAWTLRQLGPFSLLLGDHLNRHNYSAFENLPEDVAESRAIAEGDTAADILQRIVENSAVGTVPIYRASELVSTPGYAKQRDMLVQRLGVDDQFRNLIQRGVDVFMTRNARLRASRASVEPHCVAYQIEELAIFEILAEKGYRTLVYPGAQLPVMKAFACGQLTHVSPGLESMSLFEVRLHREPK